MNTTDDELLERAAKAICSDPQAWERDAIGYRDLWKTKVKVVLDITRTTPSLVTDDEVERRAREHLATAHEGAKKPLVAVDIRTGNIGRQGVMWVETTTAIAALRAALAASDRDVLVGRIAELEQLLGR